MKHPFKVPALLMLSLVAACATPSKESARAPAPPASPDTFYSKATGFSITKPSGWHFITEETLGEERNLVHYDDAEIEQLARNNFNIPLVVFARYPEPYPTLNPSVSVSVAFRTQKQLAPKEALILSNEISKQAYPDLTVVEPPRDYQVDGLQGAYTQVRYTVVFADGQRFETRVRMWLVPRGKIMFLVGMSGPPEGPDIFENVSPSILDSIRIERR